MKKNIYGIIGAMDSEVASLCKDLKKLKVVKINNLIFNQGFLHGKKVVVVKSGIGKVNAALCTQILISKFSVTKVINTGIAGALGQGLRIFDFVVSEAAVYHDFDTTAFGYKLGQVPGLPEVFNADPALVDVTLSVFKTMSFSKEHAIMKGLVASGDQFISAGERKNFIKSNFNPVCVEMEGSAIAQACYVNNVPFVIIRCMSDMADETVASTYSFNEETCADFCSNFVKEVIAKLD